MLSCKFVSLLLLAFVALAVAGTLQSTRSLKVPVLVAEGGHGLPADSTSAHVKHRCAN